MTRRHAFSLIELLVVIGVIAVLTSMLLPALGSARQRARETSCLSNQRQMTLAWLAYANDYRDRVMPLAYWSEADIGGGEVVYWWGTYGSTVSEVDPSRGFLGPYLGETLSARSVFECPSQPWGSYSPQAGFPQPTSTYGYNGYYLSPARTPGWGFSIGHRPWRRIHEIVRPSDLFVFADTLLPVEPVRNCALLDPPQLWDGWGWSENPYPTTAFRHGRGRAERSGSAVTARADASVRVVAARPEWIVHARASVGSAGTENAPHYVPDAAEWR